MRIAVFTILIGGLLLATVAASHAGNYGSGLNAAMRGDFKTAYKEWRRPAELGIVDAQFALALICEQKAELECSRLETYVWYSLAIRRSDKSPAGRYPFAKRKRDQLEKQLSDEELKTANSILQSWQPGKVISFQPSKP